MIIFHITFHAYFAKILIFYLIRQGTDAWHRMKYNKSLTKVSTFYKRISNLSFLNDCSSFTLKFSILQVHSLYSYKFLSYFYSKTNNLITICHKLNQQFVCLHTTVPYIFLICVIPSTDQTKNIFSRQID